MNMTRSIKRPGAPAFTLLELLVSMTVMAIVLTVMFAALSTSMSLWRNTDSKIASDREARAVEFLLARDLANIVVPAQTNFWPKTTNVSSADGPSGARDYYLGFLTAAAADMQSASGAGAVGDVCYAEYAVVFVKDADGNARREVRRFFMNSGDTFTSVIKGNTLPQLAKQAATAYQSLGLNLLPTNNMAARGLGPLPNANEAAFNTNFVLLNRNMLPLTGAYSTNNYPAAIEVNFSVADRTTLANTNVINRANYVIRNAGLYSFRLPLPKPPNAP